MPLPIITDRPQTLDDVDAVLAWYADPEAMRQIGPVADRAQAIHRINTMIEHQQRHGISIWAVELRSTGEEIGDCGLKPLDDLGPEIELGYHLIRGHWGNGYALEAARATVDFGFGEYNLDEIWAVTRTTNTASRRVLEGVGMTYIGQRNVYGGTREAYVLRRAHS